MKNLHRLIVALLTIFVLVSASAAQAAEKKDYEIKEKVFIHYPHPGNGAKPPQGAVCTAGDDNTVQDYKTTGWTMPAAGLSYKINPGTFPGSVKDKAAPALVSGFETWNNEDKHTLFKDAGTTQATGAKRDGTNLIAFKRISSSAIAITYTWYRTDTNEVIESDTLFNSNLPWTSLAYVDSGCVGNTYAYDVQNIATHEFGHWVGLDDLYYAKDSGLTMYGYGSMGEVKKDTLSAGDKLGLDQVSPN